MAALREFVADLLEAEGAAVEPVEPDGLDVVAAEPLRVAMGWPEFARLGFGATIPAAAIPVRLEGDWLGRFGALIGGRGRFAERQVNVADHVAPPSDPERMLDRALDLPNAAWRLSDVKPTWTRCLLLALRYTATSDEKREGLIWLGFNQSTAAVLDADMLARLRKALDVADWRAVDSEVRRVAELDWDVTRFAARVRPLVEHRVRSDLEPFLKAMRRRLDRDCGRIHEYHDGIRRAAQIRLAALESASGEKAASDRKRETMRIAAIEREYAAKLDDLRHNYALRVTVDWTQGLTLFAPVYRYRVLIRRRKGERFLDIDWHAAGRMIEPTPCDWGAATGRTRLVCDDHLHLTDPAGQAPCPSCSKIFCRACHPAACPRCRRTV